MDNHSISRMLRPGQDVISLDEARDAGLTTYDVACLVWSGRWQQVAHRTYQLGPAPRSGSRSWALHRHGD